MYVLEIISSTNRYCNAKQEIYILYDYFLFSYEMLSSTKIIYYYQVLLILHFLSTKIVKIMKILPYSKFKLNTSITFVSYYLLYQLSLQ